ncbi:hypothetical protein NIES3806_38980 [Microcystis aeruginosa NIES-3806]|nr:hypothetical protein NIES3806_38980 [Microcystis aeruginosa NIES-3806]
MCQETPTLKLTKGLPSPFLARRMPILRQQRRREQLRMTIYLASPLRLRLEVLMKMGQQIWFIHLPVVE